MAGRSAALATLALVLAAAPAPTTGTPAPGEADTLQVAADPNNLPFSNQRGEGFENEIARMLAHDLGDSLAYVWWPQRRGFIRSTLNVGAGEVVIGVPAGYGLAATTRPYYRSTFVFVSRADRGLRLRTLDDPALRTLRIGVPVIGGDFAQVPPVQALVERGIVDNLRGYTVTSDLERLDPPFELVEAVTRGEVDVGIAWGPPAGWFARRSSVPLALARIEPAPSDTLPFTFGISMAVRRDRPGLRDTLDAFIARRGPEIRRVLESYGVPLVEGAP